MKTNWIVLINVFLYFNVIKSNTTSKAGNYAASRGSTVRMKCIPSNIRIDKSQFMGRKSFVWTDEEGKEIMNPRAELLLTGELQISRLHDSDSGVYHCKFRPLKALTHDGALSKIFVHKLIVYELSGHKFQTLVTFDVTQNGSEVAITVLRNMLRKSVCVSQLCLPGPVNSEKCEISEMEKQMCEISITYEGVEVPPTHKCNEACVRNVLIDRLKKAQRFLETALEAHSTNRKSLLKPDMQSFDTKHILTCRTGYHLVEANYEKCFPCLPGTFSEPESLKCEFCPIGFYQERFGGHECEQCLDGKTTESVGSKSRDDCRPITDTGIFKDIKKGIASLFKG